MGENVCVPQFSLWPNSYRVWLFIAFFVLWGAIWGSSLSSLVLSAGQAHDEASIRSHAVLTFLVKIIPQSPLWWWALYFPSHRCLCGFQRGNLRSRSHTGGKGLLICRFFLNLHFIGRAKTRQMCPLSSLLSDLLEQTSEYARWVELIQREDRRDLKHPAFLTSQKTPSELRWEHASKSLPACFLAAVAFKHAFF